MERSHTPLSVWFWAAYLVASQTQGMSAVQFQRQLGLTRYETAFGICISSVLAWYDPIRTGLEAGPESSSEKSCLRAPARRSITPRQPVSSHTRSKASAGPRGGRNLCWRLNSWRRARYTPQDAGGRRSCSMRSTTARRRRSPRAASRHGVARRGASRRPAGRRDAVCPALREGRHGGGSVRVYAIDAIILAPPVGGTVRAAAEQAVQHGQERRTLPADPRSVRASRSPAGAPRRPRAGSRRFADRRGLPRSSCGNTWRGTRRQLDLGAHTIGLLSRKINNKQRKTWHYNIAPRSPHP